MTVRIVAGGPGDFMTVRKLTASGTQQQIGRELAAEANAGFGWRPLPADPVIARARRQWFAQNWPQHHARMRGAAEALGVDFEADRVHLDALTGVPAGSACSAVYCAPVSTQDGHGIFGRNYDFFTTSQTELFAMLSGETVKSDEPPMASRPYLLSSAPEDGPASVVLTMNELDGCMDGINEHGLTVTLLIADADGENAPVEAPPQVGLSSVQLPRFLLDTCANVDEAKQALLGAKQYDLGAPLHYLIADANGRAFVWERGFGGTEHIIDLDGGALCVTNHLLHKHSDPEQLPADNEETMLTYERYREVSKHTQSDGLSLDRLRETLDAARFTAANAEHFPVRTLWRTVFDVTDRTMATHFYLGDGPDGEPRYSPEIESRPGA